MVSWEITKLFLYGLDLQLTVTLLKPFTSELSRQEQRRLTFAFPFCVCLFVNSPSGVYTSNSRARLSFIKVLKQRMHGHAEQLHVLKAAV